MSETIKMIDVMPKLGKLIRVRNAPSIRNPHSTTKNQFIIEYENGEVFQSYNSICGLIVNCELYLTSYHDYSTMTSRYVTAWTRFSTKERRNGLNSGNIKSLI